MLQMLWCPNTHADSSWGPRVSLHWRRRDELTAVLAEPPVPHLVAETGFLPYTCTVHPEHVTDYPWYEELPPDLGQSVRADEYDNVSFRSAGWKVAGSRLGVTDLVPMDCPKCDTRMELLLTISSEEEQAGAVVGRFGDMRIFICRQCPDRPHRINVQ